MTLTTSFRRSVAIASVICLAGCGASSEFVPSDRELRLGVIPGAQDFVTYVMESRGLFDEYDVHPEKVQMLSPANLHLMIAEKKVDVGFAGFTTMAIARARGKDVITFYGVFSPVNVVVVPLESNLETIADLKGKKLGIFGGPSSTTFTFLAVIAKRWYGLDLRKSAELVTAPGPALAGLLDRGDIDAALMGTTESLKFEAKGTYRVLLDLSSEYRRRHGRSPAHVTLATNEAFASSHGPLLKDFLRAYRDAVAYATSNPEIWEEYGERIEMTEPSEIHLLRRKMTENLVSDWDAGQIETQREYLAFAFEVLGESDLGTPPEDLIRDDFNP
jgi:ABC-type nitrate/sulfonate/bicarbonate transport system substrate-binding protein